VRIVHLSDIHFWQYVVNPLRLMGKRAVGMTGLLLGRARRFRLERVPELVERVSRLGADHILITGDLTTTALPSEFRAAQAALAAWLGDPARVTIVPGNHDRYTMYAHRSRRFERYFGAFCPGPSFPFLRKLDQHTAILGLDPTRFSITASGKLPRRQLIRAQEMLATSGPIARLLIACHYPASVPPQFEYQYAHKQLINKSDLEAWLRGIGPHIYCCGHLHVSWAYRGDRLPDQLSLNSGAPLLRDRTGKHPPGFLEIALEGQSVAVFHHGWTSNGWIVESYYDAAGFFTTAPDVRG
jgi:Calcineurin-like phosphoesterase